jgi:hypothetical protein
MFMNKCCLSSASSYLYFFNAAEMALQAIRSGRTKTIPLEEVMRRHGLTARRKSGAKRPSPKFAT